MGPKFTGDEFDCSSKGVVLTEQTSVVSAFTKILLSRLLTGVEKGFVC